METNIFAIANRQLPITFVYSGQDSLIETEISRELAVALKLKPEEFAQMDSNNHFIYPGTHYMEMSLISFYHME
jgi:predicted DNA-binding protein (MmcQ/YjbR family)